MPWDPFAEAALQEQSPGGAGAGAGERRREGDRRPQGLHITGVTWE